MDRVNAWFYLMRSLISDIFLCKRSVSARTNLRIYSADVLRVATGGEPSAMTGDKLAYIDDQPIASFAMNRHNKPLSIGC